MSTTVRVFKSLIIFILLIWYCKVLGNHKPEEDLKSIILELEKIDKIRTVVDFKIYFANNDSFKFSGTFYYKRYCEDVQTRGKVLYKTKDSILKLYDGCNSYRIDLNSHIAYQQTPQSWYNNLIFKSNESFCVYRRFFYPRELNSYLKIEKGEDKIIDGTECSSLKLYFSSYDSLSGQNTYSQLYYNKVNHQLIMEKAFWYFGPSLQYYEIKFSHQSIVDISDSLFSIDRFIKMGFKVYDYSKYWEGIKVNNSTNKTFINLDVINISSGLKESIEIKGKYFLLDFWFIGCKPCINAKSEINKLIKNSDYSEKIVLLELNFKDNNPNGKKHILNLSNEYSTNNTFFITEKTIKLFDVKGYPTLILLDPNGKILWTKVGFENSYIDELKVILK